MSIQLKKENVPNAYRNASNEELAKYAGKQFIDIYADFCFIPKE